MPVERTDVQGEVLGGDVIIRYNKRFGLHNRTVSALQRGDYTFRSLQDYAEEYGPGTTGQDLFKMGEGWEALPGGKDESISDIVWLVEKGLFGQMVMYKKTPAGYVAARPFTLHNDPSLPYFYQNEWDPESWQINLDLVNGLTGTNYTQDNADHVYDESFEGLGPHPEISKVTIRRAFEQFLQDGRVAIGFTSRDWDYVNDDGERVNEFHLFPGLEAGAVATTTDNVVYKGDDDSGYMLFAQKDRCPVFIDQPFDLGEGKYADRTKRLAEKIDGVKGTEKVVGFNPEQGFQLAHL